MRCVSGTPSCSQTAHVEAVPAEYAGAQEPSTAKVSAEIDRLGLSSSDSEDEGGVSTKKSSRGKKLKSGKTAKLTSRVVTPQLSGHTAFSVSLMCLKIAIMTS